jgi:hypothetical protein
MPKHATAANSQSSTSSRGSVTLAQASQLIDALVRYAYNADFDEFRKLYVTQDVEYLKTKYKLMQTNVSHFFGQLDDVHRARFIRFVVARFIEKSRTTPVVIVLED